MLGSDSKLDRLVSTGTAYSHSGDARALIAVLHATVSAAAAIAASIYVSATGRWSTATAALVIASVCSAIYAAALPWGKISKYWSLTLFWIALAGITSFAFALEVPMLSLLMLLPLMALAYLFWRDRLLLVTHTTAGMVAFALPTVSGDSGDAASQLIVTLPAIIAVTGLSGILSDRFQEMRRNERCRYKATIEALSTALTARDGYTGSHSQETLWLVQAVCTEIGLNPEESDYVSDVALLHDIGKIGIPNEVLHAPGRLDEAQWEIMKQHPEIGERIVATVPGLEEVARAIRHEHEHWDGSGYPDGLRQGLIPIASRIVLVCDAFHAMTSDRPYRAAMSLDNARAELARCSGTQFDPVVVGALIHVLDRRDPMLAAEEAAEHHGLAAAGFAGAQA